MKKRIFGSVLAGFWAFSAMGQISNTLSPYSQYGIGVLADQSQSFSRGMAGLSLGVRDSKHPNVTNPASYSAVDSLTMIFDIGLSGQITSFKEGETKRNAKTADFDYAVGMFRLLPKVGACFGIIPYSNVGYNFTIHNGLVSVPVIISVVSLTTTIPIPIRAPVDSHRPSWVLVGSS